MYIMLTAEKSFRELENSIKELCISVRRKTLRQILKSIIEWTLKISQKERSCIIKLNTKRQLQAFSTLYEHLLSWFVLQYEDSPYQSLSKRVRIRVMTWNGLEGQTVAFSKPQNYLCRTFEWQVQNKHVIKTHDRRVEHDWYSQCK